MLSYLLTAWGRLRASDYANMRGMHIRLPRATQAAELGETQECRQYCLCPQHGRLAAQGRTKGRATARERKSSGRGRNGRSQPAKTQAPPKR